MEGSTTFVINLVCLWFNPTCISFSEQRRKSPNTGCQQWDIKGTNFLQMTSAQALVCIMSAASWLKACSDFHPEDFSREVAWLQLQRPDPIKNCLVRGFPLFTAEITAIMSPLLHHFGMLLFASPPAPLSFPLFLSFCTHAEKSKWEKWLNHILWGWGWAGQMGALKTTLGTSSKSNFGAYVTATDGPLHSAPWCGPGG